MYAQLNADQSAIKNYEIAFDGSNTYVRFQTSLVQLVFGPDLIWAYCANNHVTDLEYHGNNHQ